MTKKDYTNHVNIILEQLCFKL